MSFVIVAKIIMENNGYRCMWSIQWNFGGCASALYRYFIDDADVSMNAYNPQWKQFRRFSLS